MLRAEEMCEKAERATEREPGNICASTVLENKSEKLAIRHVYVYETIRMSYVLIYVLYSHVYDCVIYVAIEDMQTSYIATCITYMRMIAYIPHTVYVAYMWHVWHICSYTVDRFHAGGPVRKLQQLMQRW